MIRGFSLPDSDGLGGFGVPFALRPAQDEWGIEFLLLHPREVRASCFLHDHCGEKWRETR